MSNDIKSDDIQKLNEWAFPTTHEQTQKINELVDEVNRLREIVRVLEQNHPELYKVIAL